VPAPVGGHRPDQRRPKGHHDRIHPLLFPIRLRA
jgi:hypothetical protein